MEYVKLDPVEQTLTKQHLYESQISTLKILKKYKAYRMLRKEEIMLKGLLRRTLFELLEHINILDKILPKTKFHNLPVERSGLIIESKKRRDLESEMKDIQRKIERLNSNY